MPNESSLHHLFHAAPPPPTIDIDVAKVIRRSKARRLPKQVGAGGVFTLAIAGVGIAGFQGISGIHQATIASDSSAGSESPKTGLNGTSAGSESTNPNATDGSIKRAPADKINLCGGALAEVAPSESGLVLTVHFADAAAGSESVEGTVTMTNTSTHTLVGYTAASPAITLSQNGIVLWHSNGPMIMLAREVTLAPGASMEYPASFTPVICGVPDDEAASFRENLPAAPAGEYQLSAAIDFQSDNAAADLVTSDLATVTLH